MVGGILTLDCLFLAKTAGLPRSLDYRLISCRYIAYAVDIVGDERYTIYIKDLVEDKTLSDAISNNCYSITWISEDEFVYNKITYLSIQPLEVS